MIFFGVRRASERGKLPRRNLRAFQEINVIARARNDIGKINAFGGTTVTDYRWYCRTTILWLPDFAAQIR